MECAKEYYSTYPTIVNNIPKDANKYSNDPIDFARVDNSLAASQRAIGESSNLAQIALSYSYNFDDPFISDAVCMLSVLAQCSIDNAKRKSDIDIMEEINIIKQKLDIKKNGYPQFWLMIRRGFDKDKINPELQCPMNYIYNLKLKSYKPATSTVPIKDFFVSYSNDNIKKTSRKVEKLIERYSLELLFEREFDNPSDDGYFILRDDFDKLIEEIRSIYISKNYLPMMSALIDRAFKISNSDSECDTDSIVSKTCHNRTILLKTLYEVNQDAFLQCFKSQDRPK